ncbi:HK97 family phage prohead protease [Fontivita pretiosa]|uniref:HK97 family phage prohead protease n=1 Tax=Fontivita pretiosa TaxID=2989684 RepID=UPI003D16C3AC
MPSELRFGHELRVADGAGAGDGLPRITGYAAVFNSLSEDLDGFREKILPGAFAQIVAGNDEVLALMHHSTQLILGRRSKGTLSIREDRRGLSVEIIPPNTSVGRDAVESVRRGDIDGMSFRFRNAEDTWTRAGGETIRTIHRIGQLLEVTLTPIPAYPTTSARIGSESGRRDLVTPNRDMLAIRLRLAGLRGAA